MHPKLRRARLTTEVAEATNDDMSNTCSQNTVATDFLLATICGATGKATVTDTFFSKSGSTFAAGKSYATKGTVISDIDLAIQRVLDKSSARRLAWNQYAEGGGEGEVEGAPPPVAEIVLTHQSDCNYYCKKRVCMKHFHFLIRVLPMGYVTPASELADLDLEVAAGLREQEEWFVLKSFEQFTELNSLFEEPSNGAEWASEATLLPRLPETVVPLISMFGCECGERRNPEMVGELQRFLSTLMLQLGDKATEFGWEEFFQTDLVERGDPLIKQALQEHDGRFKEYA